MRMKREPLTRIVVPASAVAARCAASASTDAKCCAPVAERRRAFRRERPDRQQSLDAGIARAYAPTSRWKAGTVRADFAHVAEHEPARRGRRGEHVDGREHRIRVRVVGVVDHGGARVDSHAARRPATGRNASSPRTIAASGTPIDERRRRRRERIRRVVPSRRGEAHGRIALRRGEHDRPRFRRRRGVETNGGVGIEREIEHAHALALARRSAPDVGMGIVGVQHDRASGRQRADDRRVLFRHVGDAAHEFLMLALGVVDHGDRRLRDGSELRRLARMVHAELDRGRGMLRAKTEQRQRKADRVVEVAFGREHPRAAEVSAQHRRQHFLDRRLAVAADDGDDRKRKPRAPVRRQLAERAQRVRHGDEIARESIRPVEGDERGDRALVARGVDEIVSVEALALERDEEVARRERARVGGDPREAHIRAQRRPSTARAAARRVHHVASPASAPAAAAAVSTSENGVRTPFRS